MNLYYLPMNKYFFLLFFLVNVTSQAQETTRKWTLEECINYAVEHNIDIKQLQIREQNAAIQLYTDKMSRLPDLNAGLGQDFNFGRSQSESGLYENQTQSNSSLSITSSMPLFTGFKIPNQIAKSKLDMEAATYGLEKAKENLAVNIASLFLQVLFNKEILKVSEEQLTLSKSQIERTRLLAEVGKVPMSQLYDMESQAAKDEATLVQSKNDVDLSLLDLVQSLELERNSSFDVELPIFENENVIEKYMGSILPPQSVYDHAVSVKPVIREQESLLESSRKSLKIAESGYYPSLGLNMGYRTNYYYNYDWKGLINPKTNEPMNRSFSNQFRDNSGEYVGLSLNIPIFNRFQIKNQVKSARLNIHNQELALENTKKTLYKEIQTAYLNATAAQEKFNASERAVTASGEAFRYAQERYEVGKSSVFEFNEAKTKWMQSQSERIQAKYDYIFRAKILDFYNGIPIKL